MIITSIAGNAYVTNGTKVSEKETYQIETVTNDSQTFWYIDAKGNTKNVTLGGDDEIELVSEGDPRIEVITDKYARFGIKEVRYAIRVPD
ncbi:MAG: hypothetical protein ACI37Z_01100 [Candidatus Gastranaerophilaceae bacterium]